VLALKNRVFSEFTVLNIYFLSFGILTNLIALAQKNRVCPKIFQCIEILFVFQDF